MRSCCTHASAASLDSKTQNHGWSHQRQHQRYQPSHLSPSPSSTTIIDDTIPYQWFSTISIITSTKDKYETSRIHHDKAKSTSLQASKIHRSEILPTQSQGKIQNILVYPKTCMIRRDKTLLRAPVPGLMHARQWVTGLHLAGQTTGDEGGWVGGGAEWWAAPKRGHRSFYACSLFISCAITLKIPARCSAQEVHALLQKRWMVVHCCWVEKQCIGVRGCFQWGAIGGRTRPAFLSFLCRLGAGRQRPSGNAHCGIVA